MQDAITGALALSAYADALGLRNEKRGLKGEVSPFYDGPLPMTNTFRDSDANPWNIWAPLDTTRGLRGVVSDDTAVRAVLIEPWLASLPHTAAVSETSFERWLSDDRTPEQVSWREAMAAEQARQWLQMFRLVVSRTDPEAEDLPPKFYVHDAPLIYGVFLYHEIALAFAGRPSQEVFSVFSEICRLDAGPAAGVTGVMAVLAADAAATDPAVGVDQWAGAAVDSSLALWSEADEFPGDNQRPPVRDCYFELGVASRHLDPESFLSNLKSQWHDPSPEYDEDKGLKHYDAVLQLGQTLACLGYGGDDWLLALRVAASISGDTDTVATHLGLLIGAKQGWGALRESAVAPELVTVAETTEQLFGRSLDERVQAIASYHPRLWPGTLA